MAIGPEYFEEERKLKINSIIKVIDESIKKCISEHQVIIDVKHIPVFDDFVNEVINIYQQAGWNRVELVTEGRNRWKKELHFTPKNMRI